MMVEVSDEMTGHALKVAPCQRPHSAAASARARRGGFLELCMRVIFPLGCAAMNMVHHLMWASASI
jgi:hypothetical protein